MQAAVDAVAPRLPPLDAGQGARCTATTGALPWWDLWRRCPSAPRPITWDEGVGIVRTRVRRRTAPRSPGSSTAPSTSSGSTPSRATARSAARSACRSSATARSCCSTGAGSVDSAQTTAHELGHAYHNTTARRAHAAAAPAADGAGRDGEHLLRDARRRGGPAPAGRRRAAGAARRRPRRARRRSSSTSTAASCSRPRCSPAASGARSASAS